MTLRHGNFVGVIPDSTQISFIGYNLADKMLRVDFKSGGAYHYHEVPEWEWNALRSAGRASSHLNEFIKGKYKHTKEA